MPTPWTGEEEPTFCECGAPSEVRDSETGGYYCESCAAKLTWFVCDRCTYRTIYYPEAECIHVEMR